VRSSTAGTVSADELRAGTVRERVRFPGACGDLAGELAYPPRGKPSFATLIAGPHPYMGGTMSNRLVEALAMRLAWSGGVCLRFDYGGTGESDGRPIDVAASMSAFWESGHAPEDPDRVEDAAAAADYLASLGVSPLALVGYSFGCYAATRGWRVHEPVAAVLISPTVCRHEVRVPRSWRARTLVVHSHNDFATPAADVQAWFDGLAEPKERLCMEDGDHFFRGAEGSVAAVCAELVGRRVEASMGKETGAA
jgi:alpha/beta superfamily hydrolase